MGDLLIKILADDGFEPEEIAFFLQLIFLPLLLLLLECLPKVPWLGSDVVERTQGMGSFRLGVM